MSHTYTIYLCIIWDCICATNAKLSHFNRNCMALQVLSVYCLALYRKVYVLWYLSLILSPAQWLGCFRPKRNFHYVCLCADLLAITNEGHLSFDFPLTIAGLALGRIPHHVMLVSLFLLTTCLGHHLHF